MSAIAKESTKIWDKKYTLKYGIMVPSGINVPPGKFGKNNNSTPWNNRTPFKTQNDGCSLFEVENPYKGVIY